VTCYDENYPYPLQNVICFIHKCIIYPKRFIVKFGYIVLLVTLL
jgi:hypothetical protein